MLHMYLVGQKSTSSRKRDRNEIHAQVSARATGVPALSGATVSPQDSSNVNSGTHLEYCDTL